MAVKVMVAQAITHGVLEKPPLARKPAAGERGPRRRRASVYDADGNEVFITLLCLKCHRMRPLSQFGLRRMADGAIRNQPWCRTCRSGASEKQQRPEAIVEAPAPAPALAAHDGDEPRRARGSVATEVAAALDAGRR